MTSATTLTHTPRVVLMCSVLLSRAPTVGNSRCRLATSVEYTPPTFPGRCSMLRRLTFLALLTFAVVTTASAQSPSMPGMPSMPAGMVMLTPDEMKWGEDRKSTRLNSSHGYISYAVFCLKKKKPRQPALLGTHH